MRMHEQAEIRIVVDREGVVYCNRPEAVVIHATGRHDASGYTAPTIEGCGGCGAYHLSTFAGDCREDDERYFSV